MSITVLCWIRYSKRAESCIRISEGMRFTFLDRRLLRVPEDLSVTGFDGLGLRRNGTPVLTAIRQPFKESGGGRVYSDNASRGAGVGKYDQGAPAGIATPRCQNCTIIAQSFSSHPFSVRV